MLLVFLGPLAQGDRLRVYTGAQWRDRDVRWFQVRLAPRPQTPRARRLVERGHYRPRAHTRSIVHSGVCVDFYSLILKRSGFFSGRVLGASRLRGAKIGDGRRVGCHRRGLLNRLVRGRTEPPICTCTSRH